MLRSMIAAMVAVAAIASALASPSSAQAPDGSSPQNALPLASGSASGVIVGSSGGEYRYYTVDSPGAGAQIALSIAFTPTDTPIANAVGLVAWQQGAQIGSTNGVSPSPGRASVLARATAAGPITLQVYSYYPGAAVAYTVSANVTASGTPAAQPTPTQTASPLSARAPAELARTVSAVLPSNPYGSFHYYEYDYPGDGSIRTLTIRVEPPGLDTTNAVFVSIYQDGALLVSQSVGQSPVLGVLSLSYSSTKPGPVLVQIGNYNFARTIAYTLTQSP